MLHTLSVEHGLNDQAVALRSALFLDSAGYHVPCANRPFEWEFHASVSFTTFFQFFARDLVPSCVFLVLSSRKALYNKCVQIRRFN